jgi:ADP-ribose pyrophosphatase YjhB (NUDIX family)
MANAELSPAVTELLQQFPAAEVTGVEYDISAHDFAKHKIRQETTGVVGGVIGIVWLPDNTLPLVRRTRTLAGWALPGGGVERGVSYVDTMVNEMREEIGVELVANSIRLILLERRVFRHDGQRLLLNMATFDADAQPGQSAYQTEEATTEGLTVATFTLDTLPPQLIFADRDKIMQSAELRGIPLPL